MFLSSDEWGPDGLKGGRGGADSEPEIKGLNCGPKCGPKRAGT